MNGWPGGYQEQVKQTLDDSSLPTEEYDTVLEEWSKGEYEKSPLGEMRSLADLQTMILNKVCKLRGIEQPDLHAKALAMAQHYKGE